MRLKLLEPHQGLRAGAEWNCPWAAVGRKLIEEGKALALEPADLHLNPSADDESEPDPEADPGSEAPVPKKKSNKRK